MVATEPLEKTIEVGDIVELKGTGRLFGVRKIYPAYVGSLDETWCVLAYKVGDVVKETHWNIKQLELKQKRARSSR